MSQKTAILAVIVALVGLGMVTSAYAKQFGNDKHQYTTDTYPVSSPSDGGGEDDDSGSSQDDDEDTPVIIYIDIDSVEDDSI